MPGSVQTVLGPVSPGNLGPTTTHEHLLIDFTCMFNAPEEASERFKAFAPVTMENLGWVRYDPFRNKDNLEVMDESLAVFETLQFKAQGGRTIVDATTYGIGRDPRALARISRLTGRQRSDGRGLLRRRCPSRRHGREDRDRAGRRDNRPANDRRRRYGHQGGNHRRAGMLLAAHRQRAQGPGRRRKGAGGDGSGHPDPPWPGPLCAGRDHRRARRVGRRPGQSDNGPPRQDSSGGGRAAGVRRERERTWSTTCLAGRPRTIPWAR